MVDDFDVCTRRTLCVHCDRWSLAVASPGKRTNESFGAIVLSFPESIFELVEALERSQQQRGIYVRGDQSAVNRYAN